MCMSHCRFDSWIRTPAVAPWNGCDMTNPTHSGEGVLRETALFFGSPASIQQSPGGEMTQFARSCASSAAMRALSASTSDGSADTRLQAGAPIIFGRDCLSLSIKLKEFSMATTILIAPQGVGKTRIADALMIRLGCSVLIDEFADSVWPRDIPGGALVLSNHTPSGIPREIRVLGMDEANALVYGKEA